LDWFWESMIIIYSTYVEINVHRNRDSIL